MLALYALQIHLELISIANITNIKTNFYINILLYYIDRTKYVLQGYDDSGVREVDNLLIRLSSFILY